PVLLASAALLAFSSPGAPAAIGAFAAAGTAGAELALPLGALAAAAVGGAYVLAFLLRGAAVEPLSAAYFVLAFGLTFVVGAGRRRIRDDQRRLERLVAELQAGRDAQV